MRDNASMRWAWLMALLSVTALEFAADDGEAPIWTGQLLGLTIAAVVVAHLGVRTWLAGWVTPRHQMTWILGLAGAAWTLEILIRLAVGAMWPLELLLLAGFRNGVLALAVFAHVPEVQRSCCVLSTFLMIFASSIASQWWLHGLVVAFAIIGIWWLMGSYWNSLSGRLAATSSRELPRQWTLLIPLLLVGCLLVIPVGSGPLRALAGFMPSSGGTDWYSEAARSGVGDGDALIAGTENIRSFAPIEDAPFLSSHEPSLYDLFDETYNEPVRNNEQDRAIALPKELASQQREHHLATSQQAGRQFSTLRELGQRQAKHLSDRRSSAVLYVQGRTPLHLKLQVFHAYDGVDWHPEPLADREAHLQMETLHGRPWLRTPVAPGPDMYAESESHALKVVRIDTNHLPAPTQLLGVHIDQMNRADFFAWAQPGVVRMERNKLPSQTVIHLHSRGVDWNKIPSARPVLSGRAEIYQQFGDDVDSQQVRALAQRWTDGVPAGWPQITTIVERLRQEYVVDTDARPPADCRHTVAHFLFDARRGPDYQFASAAVWLLRSLGYSCRLASGFYADPEKYDPRSRHTPVTANDVHVWAEVYAGRDHWIPIEPTPGYHLLPPPPTWNRRLYEAAHLIGQFVIRNGVWLLTGALVAGWVCSQRRYLADALATQIWRLRRRRDPRATVQATVALLEARLRRVGVPRPRGLTLSRWIHRLAVTHPTASHSALNQLARLADWAVYAPADSPCPDGDVACVCQQVERDWRWSSLSRRSEAPQSTTESSPRRPWWPLQSLTSRMESAA